MTPGRRVWSWAVIVSAFLVGLYLVRVVLLPFIAGIAIAYFLDPLLDRLEKLGLSRLIATIMLTITFFVLIIALITLIVPLLQGQLVGFFQKLPAMTDTAIQWLAPLQRTLKEHIPTEQLDELSQLSKSFGGQAVKWVISLAKGVFEGGIAIFNFISLIVITPIVSFYLLRDWDIIVAKVDGWLPRDHANTIRQVAVDIDLTIAGFVRGQFTVGLLLAALYGIGLTVIGLDFGLLIGIVTGLISFIPYFGMFIGLFTATTIAFFQFGDLSSFILVLVVFGLGQIIESIFLTPKLVGSSVGLHSVWVIFALMVGGALFGFIGVLLAVPVAATIGVLARFFLNQYKESSLYIGLNRTNPKEFGDEH